MAEWKDGDRVVVKGTTDPVYTVIGLQRGRYVGLRMDGSPRVRTFDKDGYGDSEIDCALPVDGLEAVDRG